MGEIEKLRGKVFLLIPLTEVNKPLLVMQHIEDIKTWLIKKGFTKEELKGLKLFCKLGVD